MKTKNKLLKEILTFIFLVSMNYVFAQTNTSPTQTVCAGSLAEPYLINPPTSGSTYQWTISGGGIINPGITSDNITVDWGFTPGTYIITVLETDINGCQGYDTNTLADSTETFTGEDFRIVLANNVQAFNGAYFTTGSYKTNDNGDAVLGNFDLQVKPGYLVDPGGTKGYWFPSNFGSGTYKYYIRRFQKKLGLMRSLDRL